ncbi:hypothetical protein ABQD97_03330 [Enterococcus avium]|nr:hypothetical protein [Enterococcus avium]MDT2397239.1 hypothetical protein [Enterococcus avium]MDT2448105.1 hypothetical protein [Enterococcus avium]MDY6443237.1 hypothetical protein [Enterococcus avium]MDY6449013.1 hypothetical protein [Enterococcus avium]MDY6455580.1 hypothetical protein [Enterococcus avium]
MRVKAPAIARQSVIPDRTVQALVTAKVQAYQLATAEVPQQVLATARV